MPFKIVVKSVRKKLSMSQERLARELKVSFSTVNRWENGKALEAFRAFCKERNIILEGGMEDD